MRYSERWYIECKRYTRSINWPTVYEKLSYADNHSADFLLLVTSSSVSPKCRDEINQWNNADRKPRLRTWVSVDLENMLARYPEICFKYAFAMFESRSYQALTPIAEHLARLVQAAYSAASDSAPVHPCLETASTLAELLLVRAMDLERGTGFSTTPFDGNMDGYSWLSTSDLISWEAYDRYSLRFLLSFIRLITKSAVLNLHQPGPGILAIPTADFQHPISEEACATLSKLALWTTIEVSFLNGDVRLLQR